MRTLWNEAKVYVVIVCAIIFLSFLVLLIFYPQSLMGQTKAEKPKPVPQTVNPATPIPEPKDTIGKVQLKPISPQTPTPEEKPPIKKPEIKPINPVTPTPEEKPPIKKPEIKPIPSAEIQGEKTLEVKKPEMKGISSVEGISQENYGIKLWDDFRGGLNVEGHSTRIDEKDAVNLVDALWSKTGELYLRPGFSEWVTGCATEPIIDLYKYYRQDDSSFLLAGTDTALYKKSVLDTCLVHLLSGGGLVDLWDFATFADRAIIVNGIIEPCWWDGSIIGDLGVTSDSFRVEAGMGTVWGNPNCRPDSEAILVSVDSRLEGGDAWSGYIMGYYIRQENDTTYRKDLVMENTDRCIGFIPGFQPTIHYAVLTGSYLKFYSWFGEDTVWREGQVDVAVICTSGRELHDSWWVGSACYKQSGTDFFWEHNYTKIIDSAFTWDSTFNYDDYIFFVTSGKGSGYATFLGNYIGAISTVTNSQWDTTGFFVYGYPVTCFDTTTRYKIYKPGFTLTAKFVETFNNRLWLAWSDSSKNRIIASKEGDFGIFPPELNWWVGGDDGDYINGLATFYTEAGGYRGTVKEELLVFKTNHIYGIIPTDNPDDYLVIRIASGVGCDAPRSIASIEGKGVVFFDYPGGLYLIDLNNNVIPLSTKIDPIIRSIPKEAIENISGVYNPEDRHYYLSYPTSTSSESSDTFSFVIVWKDERNSYWWFSQPLQRWLPVHCPNIFGQQFSENKIAIDSNFLIDDDSSGGIAYWPDVCMDTAGNFTVVWEDGRSAGLQSYNVYFKRFDKNRNVLNPTTNASDDTTERQAEPKVGCDLSGNFVISWLDYRNPDGNGDIYAQRFNSDGVKIGSPFEVTTDPDSIMQYEMDMAMNDAGKFVIVWTDYDRGLQPGGYESIFGRIFRSDGSPVDSDFQISTEDSGGIVYKDFPTVDMDDRGYFVVCWTDIRAVDESEDIWCQRFDSSGNEIGNNFRVNDDDTTEGYVMESSDVGMLKNGKFLVGWNDPRDWVWPSTGGNYIYAQTYDSGGAKIGSNFRVNTDTARPISQFTVPDIEELNGNYIVTFEQYVCPLDTFCGFLLYYQLVDSSGNLVGSNVQVSPVPDSGEDVSYPAVACRVLSTTPIRKTFSVLSWSVDFGGWGKQSFGASCWANQWGIQDTCKVIFASPDTPIVYTYHEGDTTGTHQLIFQIKYEDFTTPPSYRKALRYATVECFLDTGLVYVKFYKDYSQQVWSDSFWCGGNCLKEITLPDTLFGKNLSMEVKSGATVNKFYLSRFWWEYTIDANRK